MSIDLISYSIGYLVGSVITAIVIFGTFIIRMMREKNEQ